ncbi:hypothetical protein F4678DRAFT_476558 [Xylaria arbuscula]|nr:hypothetical protein F4678DRAFT_476558 [Xylaria arbuscula]
MSLPPPDFLPVLLGYGVFSKDRNGNVTLDQNGYPVYLIPPGDDFLKVMPSKESQQFWPVKRDQNMSKTVSIVLLSLVVNTDCQKKEMITEIGWTIYDMATRYNGAKGGRKKRVSGCLAPGPRGENITKLALSNHFIVKDTANHHPGTCNLPAHEAQPYHFCYRKSVFIKRSDVNRTLEEAFNKASYAELSREDIDRGCRRAVVLVGWGEENHHPQVKAASWYKNNKLFRHWDVRRHPVVLKHIPNPTYITCLDVFGVQHRAHDKEIGNNAGNRSAFTIQLLVCLCFLTHENHAQLKSGKYLEPKPNFPGTESTIARDNRPPGSAPLSAERVPILH